MRDHVKQAQRYLNDAEWRYWEQGAEFAPVVRAAAAIAQAHATLALLGQLEPLTTPVRVVMNGDVLPTAQAA